jgi:predicted 2-oxoglutarate/Fe(II)-dependent dioxygenase YbiX
MYILFKEYILRVHMDQLIQIIPVLTEEEVDELNVYTEDHLILRRSQTLDNGIVQGRTSEECPLPEDEEITRKVHAKINLALNEYKRRIINLHDTYNQHPLPGGRGTTSWREEIRVIQYEPGQEYGYHRDSHVDKSAKEYHREISVIVYLTDDFEGGATSFLHASYKPKKGYALIFPSNWSYVHRGDLVTKGTKRVAVTWYYVDNK